MIKIPKQGPPIFDKWDPIILIIITIVSIITRIWILHFPEEVCFDEVYFGNFTNFYINGQYFYDIHPPLGKLVMALVASVAGYNGNISFEGYGAVEYKNPDYITLRLTPALFGAFCAPFLYLSLRFATFSKTAGVIASAAMIADSSILTEQRFILSDGMLHFWTMFFFTVYSYTKTLKAGTEKWYNWTFISGLLLGACSSCKNTAWGLMAYVAYVEIFSVFQEYKNFNVDLILEIIGRGSLFIFPLVVVFLGSFAVHMIVLPYEGEGVAYMPWEMQDQYIRENDNQSQLWAKRLKSPSLFVKIVGLFFDMFTGNMGITQFHPSQSRPNNWPFLTGRYVDFWGSFEQSRSISCAGNPYVYYLTSTVIILDFICFKKKKFDLLMRYFVAWAFSYFPFFLVPRSMYLYHYILPLMIACMNLGAFIDTIFSGLKHGKFWKGFTATIILCIFCVSFYFYSTYSYGNTRIDSEYIELRKEWIEGDAFFKSISNDPKANQD